MPTTRRHSPCNTTRTTPLQASSTTINPITLNYMALGLFPDLYEVQIVLVKHVRGHLHIASAVEAVHDSDRTAELHRAWIRERVGVVRDMKQARNLAEQAIYDAMQTEATQPAEGWSYQVRRRRDR
jgi:hypothetical protein